MDRGGSSPNNGRGAGGSPPAKPAREERSTTALAPEELRSLLKEAQGEGSSPAAPKMTEAIAPIVMILDRPPNVVDGNLQSSKAVQGKRVDAERFRSRQERATTATYDQLPDLEPKAPPKLAVGSETSRPVPPPSSPRIATPATGMAPMAKPPSGTPGAAPIERPTPPPAVVAVPVAPVLPLAPPAPTPVPPAAPPPPAMVAISGVPNSTSPLRIIPVSTAAPDHQLSQPIQTHSPPRPAARNAAGGVALRPPPVFDRYVIAAIVVVLAAALYTILK